MKSKTNLSLVGDERGGLKMKPKHMFSYLLFAACMLVCAAEMASAATITYVGSQMNIEDDANTPTNGWRNITPAKPLDIDGDNILGTDGYRLYAVNSNPSYATVTVVGALFGGSSYGVWDKPADPSGPDTINAGIIRDSSYASTGTLSTVLLRFEITGTDLDGKTLRLGVLCDVLANTPPVGIASYTVTQAVGGSASATSAELTFDGASLDVAFFDIEGAVAGDTFVVQTTVIQKPNWPDLVYQQFAGLTFDSILPPPPAGTVVVIK